jgi:capsid protein
MAPRKTKVPTVSLRKPVLKAAAVAPALKPQAAVMDSNTGSGFGGSYSGWQSTMFSNARRAIFGQAPGDLRQDLTPWNRMAMIRKCRWAERNSGLFKQILNDMVLYSVGDGIKPQSHASTPEMQETYEAYFAEKAKRIDITNRFSFYNCQAILLRGMIRDGDSFAAKVRNATGEAKLQLMEAHRVGDPLEETVVIPGIHDGIIYGPYGEYTAVNVYKSDGGNRQILAQSMMHIVDHEYASGARGVPLLQSSINSIQDEMEILALEKQAVKDNGDVVRTIQKQGGVLDQDTANELGALNTPSYTSIANTMGGKLLVLDQGESLNSFQSNRPNSTFTGFLAALERDIAQGVLPYEFVGDSSKLGGATVRLVTAKAGRVFAKYQTIVIEQFCVPTWGYIIGQGIAAGDIPDDPKWTEVSWTTPKSVTVDAGREAANDRADVEMGLLSMSELYAQRGLDFRTEMAKRAADMVHIQDLAKEYGIPFELLFRPTNTPIGTVEAVDSESETEVDMGEDEPADVEEPQRLDEPNS